MPRMTTTAAAAAALTLALTACGGDGGPGPTAGEGNSSTPAAPSTSSTSSAASVSGGATTPQCDGRGVMIIESVVDDGTGAAQARISQLLAEHPGAQWYRPAACPSLRGSINGQSIYPVVVDYGRDFDRLCADFYAAGADTSYRNARILNNVSEAQSPC